MAKLKLNQEMIDNLCKWIENGATDQDAYILEGIVKDTFYKWVKTGKEDKKNGVKSIFSDFADALEKSRIKFKMYHVSKITQAGNNGQWYANAWMLERKCNKEYGRKDRIDMNQKIKYKVIDNDN